MPEEYVKDLVEYFYKTNKDKMHTFSYIIFIFAGLGRFIIRPFKFWKRERSLKKLVDDFETRRDNRGIMIRKELQGRYQCMQDVEEEVQKYYELRKLRMYGVKENLGE